MPDISLLQREYDVAQEESRLPSIVFTTSLVLFLVCAGAYAGLYFYNSFLGGEIKAVDKKIEELKVGDAFKNIDQLSSLGARIKMLKSLRESHTSVSKTIAKVEKMTHPAVNFNAGSFDLAAGTMKLNGSAPTAAVLLRQIELYRADKNIGDFKVENPAYGDKHSVILNVEITLNK